MGHEGKPVLFGELAGMIFQQEENIGEKTSDDQPFSVAKRRHVKQYIGGIEGGQEETPFGTTIIANNADGESLCWARWGWFHTTQETLLGK